MSDKQIIIISSFVPAHNKSPVSVNQKMLQLCCDLFDQVFFITANFPESQPTGSQANHLQIINLPVSFDTAHGIHVMLHYVKMQLLALPVLKELFKIQKTPVLFWLSGPMLLPFLYCKLRGIPTIGFLYGNSILKSSRWNPLNRLKSWLMRYIAIHADVSCVESPAVLAQWGYSVSDQRFRTVHLFADTTHFCETIAFEQRSPVIGMCCRLVPNKRVLESIDAFHIFRGNHPEYRMQIVGSGPLEQGCRNRISELNEQDHIELLGWITHDHLAQYYNGWQLLLHPTNYEGLPNSLIEAMCCSTPVLSSPVGGVIDLIKENQTGWFLRGFEPATIAQALETSLFGGQLSKVARSAGVFSRKTYCYEAALENINSVFIMLNKGIAYDK